jgi:hypothetical protein
LEIDKHKESLFSLLSDIPEIFIGNIQEHGTLYSLKQTIKHEFRQLLKNDVNQAF